MTSRVAPLLALLPLTVAASALAPLPAFNNSELDVPSLSLPRTPEEGPASVLNHGPKAVLKRHALGSKPRQLVSAMPVIPPPASVDLNMPIKVPDASVDYKLIVKDADLQSAK